MVNMNLIPPVLVASNSEVFLPAKGVPTEKEKKDKTKAKTLRKRPRFCSPEPKKVHYRAVPLTRPVGTYMRPKIITPEYEAPKTCHFDENGMMYYVKKEVVERKVYVVEE